MRVGNETEQLRCLKPPARLAGARGRKSGRQSEGVVITKYRAIRTKCLAGHDHASKKEARRCDDLMLLFRCGQIHNLEIQPKFECHADGIKIGSYVGDFVYFDENGKRVVEDVKGMKTPLYRWKKKHVEAEYKIHIREV